MKSIIINESTFNSLMLNEALSKSDISDIVNSQEFKRELEKSIKNGVISNKDIEKKVKTLVASCVNKLFLTLWQRRNFYEDEIKK